MVLFLGQYFFIFWQYIIYTSLFFYYVVLTNQQDLKVQDNQIECIKTELIQKEEGARKYPVNIEGSNYNIDMDYVIMAVGSHPNQQLIDQLHLEATSKRYIKVDENYRTSDKKIYAIGDLIGTKATVAWAARSGFECAKKIMENK